jgi:hypothetical protein
MAVIFRNLARILDQGKRLGVFRPADPTLTYFTLIAPVIFFRATAPIRKAFRKAGILRREPGQPEFVANLKRIAVVALAAEGPSAPVARSRRAAARVSRPTRSGDHA